MPHGHLDVRWDDGRHARPAQDLAERCHAGAAPVIAFAHQQGRVEAAPVLDMAEASAHPHNRARGAFVEIDGVTQPSPAPRFSRTAPEAGTAAAAPGQHTAGILADWGFTSAAIETLQAGKVI